MIAKHYALIALGAVAALAVSFVAGRYSRPAVVETKVEYVERLQVVHTRTVDRVTDVKWRRVIEARPDGSSTTTESSESKTVEKDSSSEETTKSTKTAETTNTTNYLPTWTLFVTGGANLSPGLQGVEKIQPHFGVIVSRRIAGPFWGTAYGISSGTFGMGLGLQF